MGNGEGQGMRSIILGAVASLVIGLTTGVAGYVFRDSFDSPKLKIQRIQYRVTRELCIPSPETFYRFLSANQLRKTMEDWLPWSLRYDLETESGIEYDHVEDLLSKLPIRKDHVNHELSYLKEGIGTIDRFLSQDTLETRGAVKRVIAYLAGAKATEVGAQSAQFPEAVLQMYARFDDQPKQFAQQIKNELLALQTALQGEADTIELVRSELRTWYDKGRPKSAQFVGTDLAKLPNIEFEVSVENSGRTAGSVSYTAAFRSDGSPNYEITLVGQSPRLHYPLGPYLFASLSPSSIETLVYGINKLRNRIEDVQSFYKSLINDSGITGRFVITDVRGKTYEYRVQGLVPYN